MFRLHSSLGRAFPVLVLCAIVLPNTATALDDSERNSFEYRDLHSRLMATRSDNSIAIHMLANRLRSGDPSDQSISNILIDHKNRVSSATHFQGGRSKLTIGGGLRGGLSTNPLVEKVLGTGMGLQAGFDLEFMRLSGQLLAVSGRVQRQTGHSYVLGDGQIVPKGCGVLGGEVSKKAPGFASGNFGLDAKLCYEYTPSNFTPLAAYELKHQSELSHIEKYGGRDVAVVADAIYEMTKSLCGNLVVTNPQQCGPVASYLKDLRDSGFAADIPTDLRNRAEVEAEAANDPATAVVIKRLDANGQRIAALEQRFGRELSKLEASILLQLTDRSGGAKS